MQSVQQFVHHYFIWIFLFAALWNVVLFFQRWRHHKLHGVKFPPLESQRILFHERRASGSSCNSKFKLFGLSGGALKVLEILVTESEIWIRTHFPYAALAIPFDLEHRIPKIEVINVQRKNSSGITLDFTDSAGKPCRFTLHLKEPTTFLEAIKLPVATSK